LQPLGVTKIPLKGNKKTGLEDGSRQPESKPENKVRKKEVKHFFILNKAFFDILVQEKSCRTKKVHNSRFMVHGSRFKVQGSWFKVQGSWFMVYGSRTPLWLRAIIERKESRSSPF